MENQNIEAVVLQAVKDCCYTEEDSASVTPTSLLKADLNLDSLDEVEVIMEIEKKLDISIPNDWLDNMRTAQDLINVTKRTVGNGI